MSFSSYADIQLVTPQTFSSTILADGQTRLWFRRLLREQAVLERLVTGDSVAKGILFRYRGRSVLGTILFGLSAVHILAWAATAQYPVVWPHILMAALALLGAASIFFYKRRADVAWLAAKLVEGDLSSLPASVTLYQMGEIYGERYRAPSLVDVIWIWNQSLRNAFVVIFLAMFGIYFVSFSGALALTILYCWGVCLMVQAAVFFSGPVSDAGVKQQR